MGSNSTAPKRKTTLAGWKKSSEHPEVTLPSGTEVTIRLPDLPALVESGQIPNELVDLAVQAAQGNQPQESTKELVHKQIEFTKLIISKTVVEPAITEDDVADLPTEDKEMLVNFATRVTDIDAVGNHIGGLHSQAKFRAIRGLPELDEGVARLS